MPIETTNVRAIKRLTPRDALTDMACTLNSVKYRAAPGDVAVVKQMILDLYTKPDLTGDHLLPVLEKYATLDHTQPYVDDIRRRMGLPKPVTLPTP